MTPRQLDLARHALGLPNEAQRSYRNRYFIPKGSDAEDDWLMMMQEGLARIVSVPDRHFICFGLTHKGALLAISDSERLDPEDFHETRKVRA